MKGLSASATRRRLRVLMRPAVDRPVPILPPDRWRGSGPVVLVGGFCTTALTLDPLRGWLTRLGYTVTTHTVGAGMGCAERSVAHLREVVRDAAGDGQGVRLVGYSRGGQFARAVAQDPTVPVRSLVTLGTPFDLFGMSRPLLLQAAAVTLAGTLGVPGLLSLSCLYGSCCAEFRGRLRAPVSVPFAAIYSKDDELVRWTACLDPIARTVEVPGSHLGLLVDPVPLHAVAEELHRCDDIVAAVSSPAATAPMSSTGPTAA